MPHTKTWTKGPLETESMHITHRKKCDRSFVQRTKCWPVVNVLSPDSHYNVNLLWSNLIGCRLYLWHSKPCNALITKVFISLQIERQQYISSRFTTSITGKGIDDIACIIVILKAVACDYVSEYAHRYYNESFVKLLTL